MLSVTLKPQSLTTLSFTFQLLFGPQQLAVSTALLLTKSFFHVSLQPQVNQRQEALSHGVKTTKAEQAFSTFVS